VDDEHRRRIRRTPGMQMKRHPGIMPGGACAVSTRPGAERRA
jgi:hypothetical protein